MSFGRYVLPLLLLTVIGTGSRAALGAAAPPNTREIVTRHYRIHTDLDFDLANDLAQRLDAMYEAYSWRLRLFAERDQELPRFEVYLFRDQKDYLNLIGRRMQHTGGVFMAGRNLLASFLNTQGRDAMRRTLQHEAFHQFAHTVVSPNMPVWLNEGLAQVFEEAIWNGSNFGLEQVPPRRIRQLQEDLKWRRLVKFDALMSLSPMEWAKRLENDHTAGATQYNQAWAMVYFLINARDDDGGYRYRQRLLRMLELLHDGQESGAAFKAAFGTNIEGFEKRFVEYARDLKPTGQATVRENQEVLADLLVELKRIGKTFASTGELRQGAVQSGYRMTYTRGSSKWQTDANVANYFRDADGKTFEDSELFFQHRPGAPLPDLVCRYSPQQQFRTRFFTENGEIQHEVLVEAVVKGARIVGTGRE